MLKKKFNKTVLKQCMAVSLLSVTSLSASAATMSSSTFTMYSTTLTPVGTDGTVTGSIDGTNGGTWAVSSTTPFFGFIWAAHNGTTFGPGTYSFNTGGGTYTGVAVGAGQVGGHILFDWNTTTDIDVVLVWDVTVDSSVDSTTVVKSYTSTNPTVAAPNVEPDGVGIPGVAMIDGAFPGFSANFDFTAQVPDTTPPIITRTGSASVNVPAGAAYSDDGATCQDDGVQSAYNYDADIVTTGLAAVDTSVAGPVFNIDYDCDDANGNSATTVSRAVTIVPPDAVTTLIGDSTVSLECSASVPSSYTTDLGANCVDPEDNSGVPWTSADTLPAGTTFVDSGDTLPVDITTVGATYSVIWTCTDSDTNDGTATRTLDVVDTTAPVFGSITLADSVSAEGTPSDAADGLIYFEINDEDSYVRPTIVVSDSCDTALTTATYSSGTVVTTIADGDSSVTSTLVFSATDGDNAVTYDLEVEVRSSDPIITLVDGNLAMALGDDYTESGVTVVDLQDGDITTAVTSDTTDATTGITVAISSDLDTAAAGEYTVTYTVTDSDNNVSTATRTVTVAGDDAYVSSGGNFTMLDPDGIVFGGTNDVLFNWSSTVNTASDGTDFNITIVSAGPQPFFGSVWDAHDIRVFGPGTYSFDTGCTVTELQATGCPAGSAANTGPAISMTVPEGYLGAHMLFDWSTSSNIDVVNVWEQNGVWANPDGDASTVNDLWSGDAGTAPDPTTTWDLVSIDINDDGFNGSPMIDGPFIDFYANFNAGPGGTTTGCTAPATANETTGECEVNIAAGTAILDSSGNPIPLSAGKGDKATQLGAGMLNPAWLLALLPLFALLRRRQQ